MKSVIKLLLWTVTAAILYLGSYFLLLEEGTAINRQTFLPEYSSISRFSSSERKVGPLSVQVTYTTWLNPIFEPLDKIFRRGPSAPLKLELVK